MIFNFGASCYAFCYLSGSLFACGRSVDMKGTFEAKGVANAKSRLQFVAAEVSNMHACLWVYVRSMYCGTTEEQPPELQNQPLSACVRSTVYASQRNVGQLSEVCLKSV